uniref:Uncharacterized protein n=1 Tax=Aegilops tauschii subsp. strangulata TaxID=200361 RepID=A0A453CA43_AEGTS
MLEDYLSNKSSYAASMFFYKLQLFLCIQEICVAMVPLYIVLSLLTLPDCLGMGMHQPVIYYLSERKSDDFILAIQHINQQYPLLIYLPGSFLH